MDDATGAGRVRVGDLTPRWRSLAQYVELRQLCTARDLRHEFPGAQWLQGALDDLEALGVLRTLRDGGAAWIPVHDQVPVVVEELSNERRLLWEKVRKDPGTKVRALARRLGRRLQDVQADVRWLRAAQLLREDDGSLWTVGIVTEAVYAADASEAAAPSVDSSEYARRAKMAHDAPVPSPPKLIPPTSLRPDGAGSVKRSGALLVVVKAADVTRTAEGGVALQVGHLLVQIEPELVPALRRALKE